MTEQYTRPDGQDRFIRRSASIGTLPSSWLDQEINLVYEFLNLISPTPIQNISDWAIISGTFTKSSASSFSVAGDRTSSFYQLKAVRLKDGSSVYAYSYVKSAAYNSGLDITLVSLYQEIVPDTIAECAVGFLDKTAADMSVTLATLVTLNRTVQFSDKILLADDTNAVTNIWPEDDDGQMASSLSLMITLPPAADYNGRFLIVKKVAGAQQTIISAPYTMTTSTDGKGNTIHTYTYDFQISGQDRITLKGIGDAAVLYTFNGAWYELTARSSESVAGLSRFATEAEMSLTAAQQTAGEELSRVLGVNPYQLDKTYLRSTAQNTKFASNFIYKAPNGASALVNNQIIIYNGLGLAIPNGRDATDKSVANKLFELETQIVISNAEVSKTNKLLFVLDDGTWQEILFDNYYEGFLSPGTGLGSGTIFWYDLTENKMKKSLNGGSTWAQVMACGPICKYSGDGTNITTFQSYNPVALVSKTDLDVRTLRIYEQAMLNMGIDTTSPTSKTRGEVYTADENGYFKVDCRDIYPEARILIDGIELFHIHDENGNSSVAMLTVFVAKGQTYQGYTGSDGHPYGFLTWYPAKGESLW
jgi:hypothetical protein